MKPSDEIEAWLEHISRAEYVNRIDVVDNVSALLREVKELRTVIDVIRVNVDGNVRLLTAEQARFLVGIIRVVLGALDDETS